MASRRLLPALLGLLAVAVGAWWIPSRRPAAGPVRFQMRIVDAKGLDAGGLRTLLTDAVEELGPWISVEVPAGMALPRDTRMISLKAELDGNALRLDPSLDGRALDHMDGPPSQAVAGLFERLGLKAPDASLVPEDPADFRELVELLGRPQLPLRDQLDLRVQSLVQRIPRCASARMAQALYVSDRPLTLEGRDRCEQNLRAALECRPHHPRATASLAYFLTNTGRQREALDLISESVREHPGSPHLLSSLAYAARTTGLLEVADRALDRQAAATGLLRFQSGLADNTRLYLGDLDGFERGLPRVETDSLRIFYQGYARLLRRDRAGALACFSDPSQGGPSLFARLSAAYRLALEGRAQESLEALRKLEAERVQVRVPDGELTFKVAEAYGFLGEPRLALDVMAKAAVQGFGCTRWYERSPLLAEARRLAAWQRLHQTLLERQAVMEARFPPHRFEP
ncbi:MAG TPA: hypothetical protein VJ483_04050 [Holophagaceae bacterium]|nr:hypothetical protein [Holophagaceae bacterium]